MPNYAKTSLGKGKAKFTKSNQTITTKPKNKPSRPKKDEPKQFRVSWLSAAPFLMKPHLWQLLEVETDKKGKMTAVLLAK